MSNQAAVGASESRQHKERQPVLSRQSGTAAVGGNGRKTVKPWVTAVAGLSGGFVSSIVMHPLDVVNTRFQVQDGKISHIPKYKSTAHALSSIANKEGWWTLYAGLTPNLVGSSLSWGCYFCCYASFRALVRQHRVRGEPHQSQFFLSSPKVVSKASGGSGRARSVSEEMDELGPGMNLLCATGAGIVTTIITQPIWLAKTRLQLQANSKIRYSGMMHVLLSVTKDEGFIALYRGLLPSLMLVSHVALHFMAYEEVKKLFQATREQEGGVELKAWETFVSGASAKVVASTATYPFMVIRTRLQQLDPAMAMQGLDDGPRHRYYRGVQDVVSKMVELEGVRGFYKGLAPNLFRVVPAAAITFVVYEQIASYLQAVT